MICATLSSKLANLVLGTEGYKIAQESMFTTPAEVVTYSLYYRRSPHIGTYQFGVADAVSQLLNITVTENDLEILSKFFSSASHTTRAGNRVLPWPEHSLRKVIDKYGGVIPYTIKHVADGTSVNDFNSVVTVSIPGDVAIFGLLAEHILTKSWVPTQFGTKCAEYKLALSDYFICSTDDSRQSNILYKVHLTNLKLFQSPGLARQCGLIHQRFFDSTDSLAAIYELRQKSHNFGHTAAGVSYAALELMEWAGNKQPATSSVAHFANQTAFIQNNIASGAQFRIKYNKPDFEFICRNYTGAVNTKGYRKLSSLVLIEGGCNPHNFTEIISLMAYFKISGNSVIFGLSPTDYLATANEFDITYKLISIDDEVIRPKILSTNLIDANSYPGSEFSRL